MHCAGHRAPGPCSAELASPVLFTRLDAPTGRPRPLAAAASVLEQSSRDQGRALMLQGDNAQPSSRSAEGSNGTSPEPVSTVVLAAGEGTRMRSDLPKVLHTLAGRPLVEHAVRAAAGLDPDELVVVVGHGREAVGAHLDGVADAIGRTVKTAVQSERRGTGHAVQCALEALPAGDSGTVLVTYGDVPLLDTATLAEFLAEHEREGNAVTVLTSVVDDPTGYGRIVRDAGGAVTGIVEHKDADETQRAITEINSGVYAFDAAVLANGL